MSSITIGSQVLKALLAHVAYAAAKDDSRPVLGGVHLRVTTDEDDNATLHAEATDGFRMAIASAPCQTDGEFDKALPPAGFAKVLIKRIGRRDEPITLSKRGVGGVPEPPFYQIHAGGIGSRLIDGVFPEVSQLIPKQYVTEAIVDVEPFLGAVKRCDVFARENNDMLRLDIDEGLTVSANAAGVGSARERIVKGMFGSKLAIAFNTGYVVDVLASGGPKSVRAQFQGPNNPGVFYPQTDAPIDVVAVLMPMHLAA